MIYTLIDLIYSTKRKFLL